LRSGLSNDAQAKSISRPSRSRSIDATSRPPIEEQAEAPLLVRRQVAGTEYTPDLGLNVYLWRVFLHTDSQFLEQRSLGLQGGIRRPRHSCDAAAPPEHLHRSRCAGTAQAWATDDERRWQRKTHRRLKLFLDRQPPSAGGRSAAPSALGASRVTRGCGGVVHTVDGSGCVQTTSSRCTWSSAQPWSSARTISGHQSGRPPSRESASSLSAQTLGAGCLSSTAPHACMHADLLATLQVTRTRKNEGTTGTYTYYVVT
jgi:hypothetical protein